MKRISWPSIWAILALALASLPSTASAQEADSAPVTILRAAHLLDVREGVLLDDVAVVIEGGEIRSVTPAGELPPGAEVIDLGDVTLLPGLIDAHTHLLHQYRRENGNDDANRILEIVEMSGADRALLGASIAREMVEAGFTTVRDLGNSGTSNDVALRDAIAQGWVIGPRMYVSTRALAPIGGQFGTIEEVALPLVEREYVQIEGPEEAREAVRRAIYDGADWIKVIVNSGPMILAPEEMEAIVDEAHRAGVRVAAHATKGDGPAMIAARAGVDTIEHGYTISDDVLKVMKDNGITLVPTDSETAEHHQARIRRAMAAGVPIAIGSDLYYKVEGQTRGEEAAQIYPRYVTAGMSNLEVVRSATLVPGQLLDPRGRIGAVEPGAWADIIAVRGNPLEDIGALERVEFVMKDGAVIVNRMSASSPSAAGGTAVD
ncbi:amidohydrolase family protein [Alteriqipengyuania lutimaris]|nr:amidohydrolase family protein [Alteriqipengyuania lutimaris]MBB3034947.1 imidazolonepropionase-like amidohydrolase [Alteriqipengyuania lutimaris]